MKRNEVDLDWSGSNTDKEIQRYFQYIFEIKQTVMIARIEGKKKLQINFGPDMVQFSSRK